MLESSRISPRAGPKGCRVSGLVAPGGAVLMFEAVSRRSPAGAYIRDFEHNRFANRMLNG